MGGKQYLYFPFKAVVSLGWGGVSDAETETERNAIPALNPRHRTTMTDAEAMRSNLRRFLGRSKSGQLIVLLNEHLEFHFPSGQQTISLRYLWDIRIQALVRALGQGAN